MKGRAFLLACISATLSAQTGPTIGGCPVFPVDNIWNTPIDQLPVASNSSTLVNTIGATRYAHADFGSGLYQGLPIGIPFLLVPGTQQRYPVVFQYAGESDPGPYPAPLNAPREGGSDSHVIVIDKDNCKLYEMFAATPQTNIWKAGSGAIFDLRSNKLRPQTWTSADAAGLPIFAGLVRFDEVAAGEIKHAIRFTAPQTKKEFIWPARHYASSQTGIAYPPMGTRVRLKASVDISKFSATNQVIMKAMKKYGMILADNGSAWFFSGAPDSRWNNDDLHQFHQLTGANFEVVSTASWMVDPNSGQASQAGRVTVTVAPATATLAAGGTLQLTATVANNSFQGVNWAVNGVVGGNATRGFIDSSGIYRAPVNPARSFIATVTATSIAVPTAIGTAKVTVRKP